ncbi:MAG: HEAT repeat domain-containing protein [Planctomycetota bacterium]|nr:HEAT repeat domain-containing protein [Planctomycetota bacterium]
MKGLMFVLFLFAFVLGSACAFCEELDDSIKEEVNKKLSEMQEKTGKEYVAVRDRLINMEAAITEYLEKLADEKNWTSENWRNAFCAATVLLWRRNRPLCENCYNLKGLKPEEYLKRRLPEPNVIRELCGLGKEAVPIMLEILEKTFSLYRFTEVVPEGFEGEVNSLRSMEQKALKLGIIIALGRLKEKRANYFLTEMVKRRGEDSDVRAAAAESVGMVGVEGAVSFLCRFFSADDEDDRVRCGAALGLAAIASEEALDALLENLKKAEEKPSVRRSVAKALGLLASTWRPAPDTEKAEAMRLRAEEALLLLLEKGGEKGVLEEVSLSLVMLSNRQTLDKLKNIVETTEDANVKQRTTDLIETIKSRLSSDTNK